MPSAYRLPQTRLNRQRCEWLPCEYPSLYYKHVFRFRWMLKLLRFGRLYLPLLLKFRRNKCVCLRGRLPTFHRLPQAKNSKVKFNSYLCMKAVNNEIVNGWLASHADMMANDWMEINPDIN